MFAGDQQQAVAPRAFIALHSLWISSGVRVLRLMWLLMEKATVSTVVNTQVREIEQDIHPDDMAETLRVRVCAFLRHDFEIRPGSREISAIKSVVVSVSALSARSTSRVVLLLSCKVRSSQSSCCQRSLKVFHSSQCSGNEVSGLDADACNCFGASSASRASSPPQWPDGRLLPW